MAGMYAVYHGPKGLRYIANKIHSSAATLSNELEKLGFNKPILLFLIPLL